MTRPLPTQRISGPAELLDAIPYLLGFHPTESLVLIGVHAGLLGATARLDLTDTGQPDLVEHTVAALHRGGVDRLVVAVFDHRCEPPGAALPSARPWQDAVSAVEDAARRVGSEIAEALLVCRGRWWSYLCDVADCCPSGGRPLAGAPSPYALAATVDGVVALPSRAALARTLEPLPDARRAALEPLIAEAEHASVLAVLEDRLSSHNRELVRELMLAARGSTADGWRPPDDATAARLAAALTALPIRDEVWVAVDSRRLDGRPLWTDLGRRCPAPYDAAPLFLLGWASWRDGSGAIAGMAVERALASDPTYSAADLLLAALDQAVDPRSFPRLTDAGFQPGVRGRRPRGRRVAVVRKPR
ncbi:DUF4192 domain-containing protein [uncultured Jatrophihabitans sp.]|uniref:DUF4192 domain-containing protein n=1 Tax=uncultured Jatrophihabitans sp. TaxID=1610747 RepID=UPI0035CB1E1A